MDADFVLSTFLGQRSLPSSFSAADIVEWGKKMHNVTLSDNEANAAIADAVECGQVKAVKARALFQLNQSE